MRIKVDTRRIITEPGLARIAALGIIEWHALRRELLGGHMR